MSAYDDAAIRNAVMASQLHTAACRAMRAGEGEPWALVAWAAAAGARLAALHGDTEVAANEAFTVMCALARVPR